jgi:uncharacterized protein YecE (DUF72 family)
MTEIRAGVGGWVYEPWRDNFYPKGLAQAKELNYASRRLTAIEINGTFYGAQKPQSFRKWYAETPEGFVFSVKGTRYATYRKVLAEAAPSIARFFGTGILELKEKLGPILWQFQPSLRYEEANLRSFLDALPRNLEGRTIRHVLEVQHPSFAAPGFIALLREYGAAAALVEGDGHLLLADVTADFVYARLRGCIAEEPTGYSPPALARWADRFRTYAAGGMPEDLPRLADPAPRQERPCFVYFISGAKERAPAAAQAFLKLVA